MPWEVRRRDSEYCVYEQNSGDLVACHSTRQEANDQMAALYASESAKTGAPMVWKGMDGTWYFAASYSNNVRDDDFPAEILSKDSHLHFENMVNKGQADPPVLLLWHDPEWQAGEVEKVWTKTVGDVAFAMAFGKFNKAGELLAAAVSRDDSGYWALSHGFKAVERSQQDPTIIEKHVTKEISLLPRSWAANKLTQFMTTHLKEQKIMPDRKEKEAALVQLNIEPDVLRQLESFAEGHEELAEFIKSNGLEIKDADPVEEDVEELEGKGTDEDDEQEKSDLELGRDEIEEAFGAVKERFEKLEGETAEGFQSLSEQVKQLAEAVEKLRASDEEKIAEKASGTTRASLSAIVLSGMGSSVIGKEETRVDGRKSEAKDGPQETDPGEKKKGLFIQEWMSNGNLGGL